MTVKSVLKRNVVWIGRLLEYELGRFTKIGIGITPPIILVVASVILSLVFTALPAPINLENSVLYLILITAAGVDPGTLPIVGPSPIYTVSPYLLDILSPLPYALRGYIAVLMTLRYPLYTYMYTITYFIPAIVAALAASVMIFSSLVREEDFFVLLREDRNRVLIFRSVLYAFIYSVLGVLTVFITRTYLLSKTPLIGFLEPVFYTFSPIIPLIPVFFIFLLAVQGVAALFNQFSSRLVYIIPVFLMIELFIFQYPISISPYMPQISDFMWEPETVLLFFDNPEYLFFMIFMKVAGQEFFSVVTYLPLFNMSQLIHTFVFGGSQGVWNLYFFDPNSFLYNSAIILRDDILFNPAFSSVFPPILFLNLIVDVFSKPFYYAIGSVLYYDVPIVLIYILNAIIFGRKTL